MAKSGKTRVDQLFKTRAPDDSPSRFERLGSERKSLRAAHHDLDALKAAIEGRPNPRRIRQRIARLVGEPSSGGALADDALEAYLRGVDEGRLDHGAVFDASTPTLAELCHLYRTDPKAFSSATDKVLEERVGLFVSRWAHLTNRPELAEMSVVDPSLYPLGDLLTVKAAVARRPQRTERLSKREHDFLSGSHNRARDASARSHAASGPVTTRREDTSGSNGPEAGETPPGYRGCDVDAVLAKAGARRLAPPEDEDPKYTFPGPLDIREEVFLDYSVILPVDSCDLDTPPPSTFERALDAPKLLAAHALELLDDHRLKDALGRVGPTIRNQLQAVESLASDASVEDVRALRRSVRHTASAVRHLQRVFLTGALADATGPDSTTIETRKDALDAARRSFDSKVTITNRQVPSSRDAKYADIIEPSDTRYPQVIATGDINNKGWGWGNWPPGSVADFFKAVEGDCIPVLNSLREAATAMVSAVDTYVAAANDAAQNAADDAVANLSSLRDRFLARTFYRLRVALASILDQIAELLPLAPAELREANKRLGLQLVYRQRWIPEGYVRGKLVGFKNLPPDTEESVRRRTLVKTSRETTTLDSFAATRQQDTSRSTKESVQIAQEIADKNLISARANASFNFTVSASFGGSFGAETATQFDLARASKENNELISESTAKASNKFNEKREVKVIEQIQKEEEFESTHTIRNLNKEITANYFYYQLLRQYLVTVELHDLRPVLLRSRELPTEGEIDHRFLATHAHVLATELPPQLASDLMETVEDTDALGRAVTDRIAAVEDREAAYEAFRGTRRPPNTDENPTAGDEWDRELRDYERLMNDARDRLSESEDLYLRARSRLDRVLSHVRTNRCRYAQAIWASEASADQNRLLEQERFAGRPLAEVTRGLIREGYHGQEEVFSYAGPSMVLADVLAENLVAGADIVASMTEEELRETSLFQELARYYADEELDDIVSKIAGQVFVQDPADEDEVLNKRRVQVAQDALVVETMPGQVPLLEGFQMARRYLAVENDCLNNSHLRGRISDSTWNNGTDDHRVYRREGQAAPVEEAEP